MLFRRKPKPLDVSPAAYYRWLMAQRPPWAWFASLPEKEQEALARIGSAYVEDVAVTLGIAIQDPEVADAVLEAHAGNADGDLTLASALAVGLADRILREGRGTASAPTPVKTPRSSMAGLGERRGSSRARPETPRSFLGTPAKVKP